MTPTPEGELTSTEVWVPEVEEPVEETIKEDDNEDQA